MTAEHEAFDDTEQVLAEADAAELQEIERTARMRSGDSDLPEDVRGEWAVLLERVKEEQARRLRGEA